MSDYRPRHAIITGGGSGIGRAIALGLAHAGARVHLVGRTADKLERAVEEVADRGGDAESHVLDVADEAATADLAARFEELDVLIHSAADFHRGPLSQTATEDFERQFAVNTRGPFVLTRQLLPALRRSRGQVVFVNSSAGRVAAPLVGLYSASKFALRALADSLRAEENEYGVRVLSVYPGRTATPMQEHIYELEGRPYDPERLLQPEDVAGSVLAALALPDTAEVTDVSIRPFHKS